MQRKCAFVQSAHEIPKQVKQQHNGIAASCDSKNEKEVATSKTIGASFKRSKREYHLNGKNVLTPFRRNAREKHAKGDSKKTSGIRMEVKCQSTKASADTSEHLVERRHV